MKDKSKSIGILCPLFSLPNEFGIGDFSDSAFKFIDYLKSISFSSWQILPLNPTDKYNSPYTSISSFALDEIYVSLPDLKKRGLIDHYLIYSPRAKRVRYRSTRRYKKAYFNRAYDNFLKLNNANNILEEFKNKHPHIYEYAIYATLKRINVSPRWNQWRHKKLDENRYHYQIYREIFKQYILYDQWRMVHQYAKKNHIDIIGDIPFYVGYDSADVFFNSDSFLLDKRFNPTLVAGVPPDYYAKDGQLWGNPVYDWDFLKKHKFKLIVDRIMHAADIFDLVRLDHFRGFDTYYTIKANEKTARFGEWKEAPGYELFKLIYKLKPDIRLIAEDLGDMREEVFALRDAFNLPGMQVVQFTIVDEEIRHNLYPHVFKRENSLIYISTHDSETGLSWFDGLDDETSNQVSSFLTTNFGNNDILTNLFKYIVSEPANMVILSISDILYLRKKGRINIPGYKKRVNWTFRFKNYDDLIVNKTRLIRLAKSSGRAR